MTGTTTMIVCVREPEYAPCGFLLCKVDSDGDYDPYADDTILVQSDWDFPGTATSWGFAPCEDDSCGTDGTVDCAHHSASDMISAAFDFLCEHGDTPIEDPGYFDADN